MSRTVAELRDTMEQAEWVVWTRYFAREAQRKELARMAAS